MPAYSPLAIGVFLLPNPLLEICNVVKCRQLTGKMKKSCPRSTTQVSVTGVVTPFITR